MAGTRRVAAPTAPFSFAAAVTPHDDNALADGTCRSLWIGGAGDVVVVFGDGTEVTFTGCTAGSILPVQANKVKSTDTTATAIVALY